MTFIDHMVSAQPGLIPQVTGALTQTRFWSDIVSVDHFSDYCCAHLPRGTSAVETFQDEETYKLLSATNGASICAYRADSRRFIDPLLNESVQTCGQKITYCGVGSHDQNEIVECRIKESNLGSHKLLLHDTRL